jgi:glutathione S-transferase
MAVHWMLIELGVSFDVVSLNLKSGAQHDPEYRLLNPAGRVPTLVVEGVPMGESAALLMLLAERHPEKGLAPKPGEPDRSDWLEQMIYLANTLLPAFRDWFYADTDGDPAGADAVRDLARKRIEGAWDKLEIRLAHGHAHMVGSRLTTADFLAVMLMRWSRNMPRPASTWPHLAAYIGKMRALPSFVELTKREGLTEWQNPTT